MHNVQSPRTDDESIEQEIQRKGLTAPRVTPADLDANIAAEHYFTAGQGAEAASENRLARTAGEIPAALDLLTFCVLTLRNGFTVVGKSACASPENFDAALGKKVARQDAVNQMWPLMGYALREQLHAVASVIPASFQDRVRHEKDELDEKLVKLKAFFETTTFAALPIEDQELLNIQAEHMSDYSDILGERIAAF